MRDIAFSSDETGRSHEVPACPSREGKVADKAKRWEVEERRRAGLNPEEGR